MPRRTEPKKLSARPKRFIRAAAAAADGCHRRGAFLIAGSTTTPPSCKRHVRTIVIVALSTRRTRTCAVLPAAVLYGRAITSYSPVSSTRRSPTCSAIGRTRSGGGVDGGGCFSGGLAIAVSIGGHCRARRFYCRYSANSSLSTGAPASAIMHNSGEKNSALTLVGSHVITGDGVLRHDQPAVVTELAAAPGATPCRTDKLTRNSHHTMRIRDRQAAPTPTRLRRRPWAGARRSGRRPPPPCED